LYLIDSAFVVHNKSLKNGFLRQGGVGVSGFSYSVGQIPAEARSSFFFHCASVEINYLQTISVVRRVHIWEFFAGSPPLRGDSKLASSRVDRRRMQ
jgi:hypothetical protein